MKQEINVFDYTTKICDAMRKGGVLLTTKAGDRVNTMTIGWGTLGVEWSTPIFTAFVRESRFTKEMLDNNPEFTVNIPVDQPFSDVRLFCGRNSGRDVDKIKEMGLHLEEPQHISVPGIRELPLTIECRVLYAQTQDLKGLPQELLDRYYPTDAAGNQDHHIAYYAEIVGAYLITE